MNAGSRIRLGMLGLVLIVSCRGRTLGDDAVADGSGAGGVAGVGGRAGGGPPGRGGTGPGGSGASGQSGTFGPGAGGSPQGAGGSGGIGVGGFSGTGATGGTGGRGGGGGGVSGRGGAGGTGGVVGIGGSIDGRGGAGGMLVAGRGGFGGTADFGGRGGVGGSGGISGSTGNPRGGAGGGVGGSSGTGGTGGVCTTCRTAFVPLDARALVYSAARNELYASVPGDGSAYPNTIVVIDPTTASVTSAIPVGSDPGPLALSDDGSTLWVGIDGAHAIRRVTMTATPPVVGPLKHLPKASLDRYFDATALAVLAGAPLSVVAALADGNVAIEARVFDDGVPRATGVTNLRGNFFSRAALTPGTPGTVFGVDGTTSVFYVYTATPSGLTATTNPNGIRQSATDSLATVGGRVFTGGGDAIDVENLAAPTWVAGLPYRGPVARRDPMRVMQLTVVPVTSPFVQRTDIRMYTNLMLTELATVSVPDSIGAIYSDLVYAGGDAAAFIRRGGSVGPPQAIGIVHDPAFGTPIGGSGGAGGSSGASGAAGTGGGGGSGGVGGTGGAPDPCPGCTVTAVAAYGRDMVHDPTRNLIYIASDAAAPAHPSTIVTVDPTSASLTSFVPVGNDPLAVALSDDGSALWVALAGERRVRRMTPGATPAPGPAYALPMLLTSGEASVPVSIAVLPGAPSSIAVGVHGSRNQYQYYYGRGVFILDDGQPRANFIQPPEVTSEFLTNGPPGYLLAAGDNNRFVVFRLSAGGATLESYGGLLASANYYTPSGFYYSAGAAYASSGEVIDLTNPDAPVPAGRFPFGGVSCILTARSATRIMMLCPDYSRDGTLLMLDPTTFTRVGSLHLPRVRASGESWLKFVYLGGDAVAMLGSSGGLAIVRAPMIGSPP